MTVDKRMSSGGPETKQMDMQKFIQMVGGGRNGKGLSNNLLLKLLGDNAYTGYGCTFDASIICGITYSMFPN